MTQDLGRGLVGGLTEGAFVLWNTAVMSRRRMIWLAYVGLSGVILLAAFGLGGVEVTTSWTEAVQPGGRTQVKQPGLLTTASKTSEPEDPAVLDEYEIIALLPVDAIQPIDDPSFYPVVEADLEYGPGELVLGVFIEGEARAYSIDVLSLRKIVNDNVRGRPIAVTW